MRAIRFACQLHFQIEPLTRQALAKEKHRLSIISQERITDELVKILQEQTTVNRSLPDDETGVLDVVLPEIAQLRGFERIGKYQHKDVFRHTCKVVDNVARISDSLPLRFAALYHDVAKPTTKEFNPDAGWTFHGHEEIGARMLDRIGKRLRISKSIITYTKKMIRLHLRPIHLAEEGVTDSAIRRLVVQAGEDLDDLLILCRRISHRKIRGGWRNIWPILTTWSSGSRKSLKKTDCEPSSPGAWRRNHAAVQTVCRPAGGTAEKGDRGSHTHGVIANDHDAALAYLLRVKDEILESTD
jgi:putative nucleotidyltransferase with HDIG domain